MEVSKVEHSLKTIILKYYQADGICVKELNWFFYGPVLDGMHLIDCEFYKRKERNCFQRVNAQTGNCIALKGQCPDCAHAPASSVFSSKDNRTVILTRQDFLPDRTANGDLLFTF